MVVGTRADRLSSERILSFRRFTETRVYLPYGKFSVTIFKDYNFRKLQRYIRTSEEHGYSLIVFLAFVLLIFVLTNFVSFIKLLYVWKACLILHFYLSFGIFILRLCTYLPHIKTVFLLYIFIVKKFHQVLTETVQLFT